MRKKLFITYLIIAVATMLAMGATFLGKGYSSLVAVSEENYMAQAKLLGALLENYLGRGETDLEQFADTYSKTYGVRITIVSQEGQVLAESSVDYDGMENHAGRIEIKKALRGENASVLRHSNTLNLECVYCAIPITKDEFQGVLRISVPLEALRGMESGFMKSAVMTVAFIAILMLVVSVCFSRYLTKPLDELTNGARKIAQGDLQVEIHIDQKDQIGSLATAFNSMTEKLKENMAQLYSKNSELSAILNSMDNGVVALDEENRIIFCNPQFKDLVEREADNITGLSIYHVLRNQILYDVIDKVRQGEELAVQEGELNGREDRILKLTGTPLYEEEKKRKLGVLVILEDVTQIRKLEHMRSDFVSNVSHEFKTPLTSIRGFVDTLKHGAIKDEKFAMKFLDIIDIETERLNNLIQDILVLSEIENNTDYNVVENDMREIIIEVINLLQPKVKPGVELQCDMDAYIRPYACNQDRMKQLLINLVDNAIKYTEQGSVLVGCKSDGNFLYLWVEDTGQGMEKEALGRIFERFYRVDKSRSSKTGGTGLGLSIVKHIVEMYNGDIQVESEVGVGSKFLVKLPYYSGKV